MSRYALIVFVCQTLAINVVLAHEGYGQRSIEDVYLDLRLENATVQAAFVAIESKTGFRFAYRSEVVQDKGNLSLDYTNTSLADILRDIAKQKKISFTRVNNVLNVVEMTPTVVEPVIETKPAAENVTVVGQVIDADTKEGLPGVTVLVKGTTNGTITDYNGSYSLTVPEEATLVFSYLGYLSQEVAVGSRSIINISLEPSTEELDEVVVVGYGTARKRDLTGSVASVDGSSIEKGGPLTIQNALAGRVAGVQISQTDNAPGSGMRVLIRGGSTLTGGNQPLYVIDNFPILPNSDDPSQNPLADLNPNDIKSVEILKDASATAIFGAEGANGVIIITTKSGRPGEPRLDVEVSTGVSRMVNVPNILTPGEYLNWQLESSTINQFYEPLSMDPQRWQDIAASGEPGRVWIDEITRTAVTHRANLSFSGGSNGMSYRLSGGYLGQEGVLQNSEFNRANISAKIEQEIGSRLKVGTNITYALKGALGMVNSWDESAITKVAFQLNPFMPPDFDIQDFDDTDPTFMFNNENVLTFMDEVDVANTTQRFIGNLFFDYEISENLSLYTSYGINNFTDNFEEFYPSSVRRGFNVNGFARFRSRQQTTTAFQSRLNYRKSFNRHWLGITGVFETRTYQQEDKRNGAENFEEESRGLYDLSTASVANFPSNIFDDFNSMSYLARVSYSYRGKYLATASFRADGSSKFGANNKWGYFPSLGLGWVISDENFMDNVGVVDLLKARVSYGVTGNNQIPTYQSLATLSSERYVFNDQLAVGLVPASVANPDLRWETTAQYNAGIDLGFFKSRLVITADVYYKKTTDLLLEVQLPLSSGFERAIQNVGSFSSEGFELAINSVNVDTDRFTWRTVFTFSTNRAEVLDLGDANELFFTRQFNNRLRDEVIVRVGEPIGQFHGYIEDGIVNSENEIANSPNSLLLENVVGQVKLLDLNGDGIVDTNDKVIIGSSQPDFIGGLTNEVTYGNFDLSILLRWSYGNDVINGNLSFMDRVGVGNWNTLQGYRDHVFTPLNPNGTVHGQVPDTYSNLFRSSFVEDGSFLKCDYITLGYTFTEPIMVRTGLKSARVFARVDNPFMITRYSWFDPEVSTGWGTVARVGPGVDVGTYPRATTFTIGAAASL